MAPLGLPATADLGPRAGDARSGTTVLKPDDDYTREQAIVEGWAQGFMVGSIILLILLLLCNYRKRVLLHKLILLELILALCHGFFIFFKDPAYGWLLSSTAVTLYISYDLHNVVSWLKIRPFLPRWGSWAFIVSLMLVQPYWVLEAWANFEYFNALGSDVFKMSRYFEFLARDPWWIFTTVKLVMVIKQNYEYTITRLVKTSPRFGVMLLCMFLSIAFLITDVAVTARVSTQSGINPFWRFALVFKCASDTFFLDDFKSVLDHIAESAMKHMMSPHYLSHNRQKSSAIRPAGSASHHEHNPGPSVSISANPADPPSSGGAEPRPPGIRGWAESRLTSKRSRDSGDDELITGGGGGEDSDNPPGQIRAETTITVSDQQRRRPGSSKSRRSPPPPLPYSNDRPSDYGWGEPPAEGGAPQQGGAPGSIPMVPMAARTNPRTPK